MKMEEFRRIAFDDWERAAQGSIVTNDKYLEIKTDNQAVKSFLCRCMTTQEIISNPVVWVSETYQVHSGAYKVIHIDTQGIVLRKVK